MRIKDTPKVDRPREKLVKYGTKKLSDAELLAIILRTGTKDLNVVELAKKVLKTTKSKISEMTFDKLKGIKGIGIAKSSQIIASLSLSSRLINEGAAPQLISPEVVFASFEEARENKKEQLIAIYLDSRNREIHREIVSIGTLNANLIHPREVFEPAVRKLSAGVIIVHNHPSGDIVPSNEDLKITKQLVEAGKIMGIPIIDHMIVTKDSYYSFDEHKQLHAINSLGGGLT